MKNKCFLLLLFFVVEAGLRKDCSSFYNIFILNHRASLLLTFLAFTWCSLQGKKIAPPLLSPPFPPPPFLPVPLPSYPPAPLFSLGRAWMAANCTAVGLSITCCTLHFILVHHLSITRAVVWKYSRQMLHLVRY